MVKCWDCKHPNHSLLRKVKDKKLLEKKFGKCKVKGIVLGLHEIMEENECSDFEQAKLWSKTIEPPNFSNVGGNFIIST